MFVFGWPPNVFGHLQNVLLLVLSCTCVSNPTVASNSVPVSISFSFVEIVALHLTRHSLISSRRLRIAQRCVLPLVKAVVHFFMAPFRENGIDVRPNGRLDKEAYRHALDR